MDEKIELKDSERQPCEVWTRVMGYHRPISSFNKGKRGEFEERKNFTEGKAFEHIEHITLKSQAEGMKESLAKSVAQSY